MIVANKLRWLSGGVAVLGQTVVGTITRTAGGEHEAHGCDVEWQDVQLGIFPSEAKAKDAIQNWIDHYGPPV